jgi:geranylgeranyl pyrophosphate synthase
MIDFEEARHRIERESLPLPIVYALQNPKTKSEISSYLLKKKLARKDTEFIIQKTDKAGGIRRCHDLMQKLAKKAYVHLAKAKYNGRDLELLIRATVLL